MSYCWASLAPRTPRSRDFYTKEYYGLGADCERVRPKDALRGMYYIIKDPTMDKWRRQTLRRSSRRPRPEAPRRRTWIQLSDRALQDFNRDFSLSSTRSLKSEGFVASSPDPSR